MTGTDFEVEIKTRDEDRYVFHSGHGVENPRKVLEEEIKLLKNLHVETTSAVLVVDSRIGIEGTVIGDRARNGRVMMTSSKARETLLSELNRRRNQPEASTEVMLTSDIAEDSLRKYNTAVYIPRTGDPLHLVKQKILEASKTLRDGGRVVIASSRRTVERLKEYAGELGSFDETIDGDVSILEIEPDDNSVEEPFEVSKLKHSIKGEKVKFQVPSGMFTPEDMRRVEMMVRELSAAQGKLLDVAVGPGLAAIYSRGLYEQETVSVSQDDYMKRFAEKSASINGKDLEAYVDEGLHIFDSRSFDSIAYNAKGRDRRFRQNMKDCFRVLRPSGTVFVVHSKDIPAEQVLRQEFSSYSVRRREGNLQITSATK